MNNYYLTLNVKSSPLYMFKNWTSAINIFVTLKIPCHRIKKLSAYIIPFTVDWSESATSCLLITFSHQAWAQDQGRFMKKAVSCLAIRGN